MSVNFNEIPIVKLNINDLNTKGYLKLWIGPMFSGKTQMLVRELNRLADTGCKVLYINHSIDTRTTTNMSTHSSSFKSEGILDTIKTNNLDNIDVNGYDVIGVDECQFYENLDPIKYWVDQKGKLVLCSGLDGDYKRDPIGKILELIPYSDHVEKLNAKCHLCIKDFKKGIISYNNVMNSPFTYRSSSDKSQILVSDDYMSLCRYHYLRQ